MFAYLITRKPLKTERNPPKDVAAARVSMRKSQPDTPRPCAVRPFPSADSRAVMLKVCNALCLGANLHAEPRSRRSHQPHPQGRPAPPALSLKSAPVAQLDRANASGALGREFESLRAHHFPPQFPNRITRPTASLGAFRRSSALKNTQPDGCISSSPGLICNLEVACYGRQDRQIH
jgi:hypothetical protein